MSGKEASRLFYNTEVFKRKGALPKRVQKTLFGVSAVQTMDGQKHKKRKHLFRKILDKEQEKQLALIMLKKLEKAAKRWESMERIMLFDEVNEILCQTVCEWAQVPLMPNEESGRTEDFAAMVSNFGAVGPKYWKGKAARKRTERWLREVIKDTRCGKLKPDRDSVLYKISFYKENGKLLDLNMAAIELINVLRPTIAVSRFITFMALKIKEYREKLQAETEDYYEMFVQEVRRYYPFAPCLGAIVKKNFKWKGYKFRKGTLVLLDVYGTNHDPRIWKNPDEFMPERFSGNQRHLFDFIPQGGGDADKGHRCPGERITIELMKASLKFLACNIEFTMPVQKLYYDLKEVPSLPESGFVMSEIRIKNR